MNTKYIIFDFDGVIGNTFEAGLFAKGKVDNLTREQVIFAWNSYFTKSTHTRKSNLSSQALQEMQKWVTDYGTLLHQYGYELFNEFVEEIAKIQNTKLAIVSRGSYIYIQPKIKNIPIQFSHVLSLEDHHSKEEKVEQVCRDWGVSLKDIYFFTDSISDVVELENLIDRNKIYGCAWGIKDMKSLLPF
jgi:phosphoserine phosphatase